LNHRSTTAIIVADALSVMRLKPRWASAKNAAIAANRIALAVTSRMIDLDQIKRPVGHQFARHACELLAYLERNQGALVHYAARRRNGEPI
jgi:hypothetical protein